MARENLLTVRVTADKTTTARMPGMVESAIRKQITSALAEKIARLVKRTEGQYEDTYTADLYVLTPGELAALIHEASQRLDMGMPVYGGIVSFDSTQREVSR